ncbi:EamA family transporter [Rivihabitans pingtungensis]|uniref:EamA family transporter n=1 Tax=Rivihabitans pingtungensis TaxID=1054498 RepID=UPI00289CDF1B|nr:EamA family transporter [Rivihabitans pingtungensis]
MNPPTHLPIMAAFAALISVQTGAAFAKSLFPLVGAEGVAALRLGLSALWLSLWFRPWRLWRAQPDWLALLGYGVMLGLMNLLIYRAFMYIHVSLAVSIEVIGPLAVALLNSRQRRDVLWVGLALLGLALLPFGQLGSGLDVRGVAYALAAALCWALYVVFGARAASGGGQAVATGMLVAALFAVPLGVAQSGAQLLTPYALAIGLVVAVLSSMLPFLLDMYAMRWLPARVFGVLLSASPAMSALAGWWVLGETLGPLQILGVSAIILACAGSALFARPASTGDQS